MEEKLEIVEELSLLMDFYGDLLPEKQREFLRLYNEENYSFQEIADEYDVSRQSVFDSVKKAQNSLKQYENKLGLLSDFRKREAASGAISSKLAQLSKLCGDDSDGLAAIEDIKALLKDIAD